MPTTRRRVTFTGYVQGVGFRYTATSLARDYPVVGYVKNLTDGRVELLVEGTVEVVEAFLDDVAAAFADNITGTSSETVPTDSQAAGAVEKLTRFAIRS